MKSLPSVAKAAVAKPTLPLPERTGDGKAVDLFDELCPVAVHQALAAFDVKKSEIVNGELARLKEAVNMTNQLLSSMNLPAAIEDTSGGTVPASLVCTTSTRSKDLYFYSLRDSPLLADFQGQHGEGRWRDVRPVQADGRSSRPADEEHGDLG